MGLPHDKEQGEWGKEAEREVLKSLLSRGFDAVMPELHFENKSDYAKYEHDIEVRDKLDPNKRVIVEVKRRNLRFKNQTNFPYPTAVVDARSTFDSKLRKPLIYVMVNKDLNGIFAVPVLSKKFWTQDYLLNREKGEHEWYYVCPIAHCISYDNAIALVELLLPHI